MIVAIRHIETRLRELADEAEANTPATRGQVETLTHELRVLAKIACSQAEMIERGLMGDT